MDDVVLSMTTKCLETFQAKEKCKVLTGYSSEGKSYWPSFLRSKEVEMMVWSFLFLSF